MKKTGFLLVLILLMGCSTPPTGPITPTTPANPGGSITYTPPAPLTPSGDAVFLPNPAWQPGVTSPAVTQDNIQSTICVSGYTATVRPPISYTNALKVQQIAQYGYADTNPSDYEEDHLISLEVGGDPKDPKNLWPQPRRSEPYNASVKDTLENVLKGKVCSGELTLAAAQHAIATDWVAAYHMYVGQTILPVTPEPTEP